MKKIKNHPFLQEIITSKFSPYTASATFFAFVLVRLSVEGWISRFEPKSFYFYFYETLHTTSFFFLLFVTCVFLTVFIAKISLRTSVTIFLFGFILIIIPPIIDWIISSLFFNGVSFMSYYLFDSVPGLAHSFLTFFGDRPSDGITYGTRVMILCALILLGSVTFAKTKSFTRTCMIVIIAYTLFFLLSASPSIITYLFSDIHFAATRGDIGGFIVAPHKILGNQMTEITNAVNIKMSLVYILTSICTILGIGFTLQKKITIALIKNIRPIQTLYHIGLLCVGMGIAIMFNDVLILPSFFTFIAWILLVISIVMAWYGTVVLNDHVDQDIDVISNPTRPLITGVIDPHTYKHLGIIFSILSIIIAATINIYAAIILIGYHAISFLYNTPPLRLKRIPFIATFFAAIASFLIVVIGYITITPDHSLTGFPPYIAILLIIAYTISLPIKDLKDIAGDKSNNIYTIPVIFGEKFGRLLIGSGIFTSFILSIFTLNNFSLFFPAVIAGSLCFWVLTGYKKDQFVFTPRATISFVFAIVFIYGIILATSLLF